jgi:hypothetical protein
MKPNPRLSREQIVSFIVRCWPERRGEELIWRGVIEHAQSGRKRAFPDIGEATRVLEDLLESVKSLQNDDAKPM